MTVVYSASIRANRLALLNSDIGASAKVRIYTGARPATPDTAISSQALLGELQGGSVFGVPSSAALTANPLLGATVPAGISNAAPTFYRIVRADGTVVCDGDVGTDLLLSVSSVSTGDSIQITSFVVNVGTQSSGGGGTITLAVTGSAISGTVGTAYTVMYTASGGTSPYTYSVGSGALPSGLTLNSSTGVVSGTPTTAASYNYTIHAADSASHVGDSPTQSVTIAASGGAASITGTAPAGTVGTAYMYTFTASGFVGAVTWSVGSGSLPAGVTLNTSTGVISGTPTTAAGYTFVIHGVGATSGTADSASQSVTVAAAATSPMDFTVDTNLVRQTNTPAAGQFTFHSNPAAASAFITSGVSIKSLAASTAGYFLGTINELTPDGSIVGMLLGASAPSPTGADMSDLADVSIYQSATYKTHLQGVSYVDTGVACVVGDQYGLEVTAGGVVAAVYYRGGTRNVLNGSLKTGYTGKKYAVIDCYGATGETNTIKNIQASSAWA